MRFGVSLFCQNYGDWPRYLAEDFSGGPRVPDHQVYDEDLQLGELVEPLGFDAIWTVEHHFTPYTMVPDALQFLTYFAGRTQKVDLGTMVVVLPWHDPVRVAEELAMLDIMLKGRRLIIGFGRGAARREFEGMRIPMGESADRFMEAQEVVQLALSQERFSYQGSYYQVPETGIRPRPRTPDLAERMYCAAQSTASVSRAAQSGLGMLIIPQKSWQDHAKDIESFDSQRAAGGRPPLPCIAGCFVYCAETDEEARGAAEEYMNNMSYSSTKHYELDEVEHFRATKGYDHYVDRAEAVVRAQKTGAVDPAGSSDPSSGGYVQTQVWGTPERCLAKIREIQETTGCSEMFGVFKYGGISKEKAERSMRLFADKVLPELHKSGVAQAAD